MTDERRNRITVAVTINVILLIVILAAVCIYQLVEIVCVSNRKNKIEEEIKYYQTETDRLDKSLDFYKSDEWMLDKAYEYGFVFGK